MFSPADHYPEPTGIIRLAVRARGIGGIGQVVERRVKLRVGGEHRLAVRSRGLNQAGVEREGRLGPEAVDFLEKLAQVLTLGRLLQDGVGVCQIDEELAHRGGIGPGDVDELEHVLLGVGRLIRGDGRAREQRALLQPRHGGSKRADVPNAKRKGGRTAHGPRVRRGRLNIMAMDHLGVVRPRSSPRPEHADFRAIARHARLDRSENRSPRVGMSRPRLCQRPLVFL